MEEMMLLWFCLIFINLVTHTVVRVMVHKLCTHCCEMVYLTVCDVDQPYICIRMVDNRVHILLLAVVRFRQQEHCTCSKLEKDCDFS